MAISTILLVKMHGEKWNEKVFLKQKKMVSNKENIFAERLKSFLSSAFVAFVITFAVLIVSRLVEYFYIRSASVTPDGTFVLYLKSIRFDLYTLLVFSGQIIVPLAIFALLNSYLAKLFLRILYIVIILANLVLVVYFGSTSLMLSTDLFGYSYSDIVHIVGASGGLSWIKMLLIAVLMALLIFVFFKFRKRHVGFFFYAPFVILSLASFVFMNSLLPVARNYSTDQEYYMANNKLGYFLNKSYNYFFVETKVDEQSLYPYFYTGVNFSSGAGSEKFVSTEYPFLRYSDTSSVLRPFFSELKSKPNIVFIVVESLGRAYSGEGAYLGSFTPFLDSLAKKSLYWENGLSTAGRTFEVLPSLLASLPYGKTGFAEMGEAMPRFQSIVSLLIKNGYDASFVYGGGAHFDNMDVLMKKQGVSKIISESNFGPGYSKLPPAGNGFTWGYGDKEIFRKYLSSRPDGSPKPYVDVILTLAMHDPYIVPDADKYYNNLEQLMQKWNFSETKKEEYRKYRDNYATIIYFNEAIRNFFNEYAKRKDFSNTIFVITGDHRMSTPAIATQIDRFHVPIIIYSPLLKNGVRFSSFASHLNVAPSLLSLLQKNNQAPASPLNHWLGSQIDTARFYRNNLSVPFIRTKSELIDYLHQDYFLSGTRLFSVTANMGLEPVENNEMYNKIKSMLDKFILNNNFACENNRLAPDSLFSK